MVHYFTGLFPIYFTKGPFAFGHIVASVKMLEELHNAGHSSTTVECVERAVVSFVFAASMYVVP